MYMGTEDWVVENATCIGTTRASGSKPDGWHRCFTFLSSPFLAFATFFAHRHCDLDMDLQHEWRQGLERLQTTDRQTYTSNVWQAHCTHVNLCRWLANTVAIEYPYNALSSKMDGHDELWTIADSAVFTFWSKKYLLCMDGDSCYLTGRYVPYYLELSMANNTFIP